MPFKRGAEYLPVGHPRRCTGIMRNGDQCTKWGRKGSYPPRCNAHGTAAQRSNNRLIGAELQHNMPKFYKGKLNKTLAKAVSEQLDMQTDEQFSVLEELALMRASSAEYVALYSGIDEALEQNPDNEALKEAKSEAAVLMQSMLKEVVEVAGKASKIHYAGKDTFTAMDLRLVVNQLTRIMYSVCSRENIDIAKRFEEQVDKQLRLPSEVTGTDITADQAVMDMDDTVPQYIEGKVADEA